MAPKGFDSPGLIVCISCSFLLLGRAFIHSFSSWIDEDVFAKLIVAIQAERRNYMFLVAKLRQLSVLSRSFTSSHFPTKASWCTGPYMSPFGGI